jgi:hypothetical protein
MKQKSSISAPVLEETSTPSCGKFKAIAIQRPQPHGRTTSFLACYTFSHTRNITTSNALLRSYVSWATPSLSHSPQKKTFSFEHGNDNHISLFRMGVASLLFFGAEPVPII